MKYLVVFILLINYANAQDIYYNLFSTQNTLFNNKCYNGNVKKVNRIYWSRYLSKTDSSFYNSYIDSFQNDGRCLSSKHLSKDSIHNSITNYQYNSSGNCVSILSKYLLNDSTFNEGVNTYNLTNQLINSKSYYKGRLVVETNITYNKNSEVVSREILSDNYSLEKVQKNGDNLTITSYNITGKKIVKQEFAEDDTSFYCHYYFYTKNNASGKEGETRMYKKDRTLYYSLLKNYDNGTPNENSTTVETKYDEHKNLTKLVTYDKIKKVNYITTINYKYDAVGNIIEKLITYDNGDKQLSKFEFEYY